MKKLTILAIILFTSVYAHSQEEIIPVPDYVNTLYVITPEGLKALEKQEASTKTKLKAATFIPYAGLFAGGTRSSVVLIGTKSSVRFNSSDIRFIYEPSVMVDPEQSIKVIPLVSNEFKEQREVQTGSSSNFRAKGNEVPKIPFTYKKYKDKYIIIELIGLPQGEYGIILGSMEQTNAELKFQLFGID
jgi:hypothetical protein